MKNIWNTGRPWCRILSMVMALSLIITLLSGCGTSGQMQAGENTEYQTEVPQSRQEQAASEELLAEQESTVTSGEDLSEESGVHEQEEMELAGEEAGGAETNQTKDGQLSDTGKADGIEARGAEQQPALLITEGDTELNAELKEEADKLGTPLAVYNYLKNSVDYEYYYGSRKGAAGTCTEQAGNDLDQASLLIAMLRYLGVEAEYVRGNIYLTEDQAVSLTGAGDIIGASEILAAGGTPVTRLTVDGKTVKLSVEHVWVRANVPYTDYRGAGNNGGDKVWIDLDTGIPAGTEVLSYLPLSLQYEVAEEKETFAQTGPDDKEDTQEDVLPPEIFIEVTKQELKAGEQISIKGYAEDDHGVESFVMYIDGEQALDSAGEVLYTAGGAGTVTIKAEAEDTSGNTAEKELILTVTDDRDRTAPTAEITFPAPGKEIGTDIQIQGTAKDESAFGKYTLSYKEEKETEYHVIRESTDEVNDDILGSLDISGFADGDYEILLTVEDAAGNSSYYSILLTIRNGVAGGTEILNPDQPEQKEFAVELSHSTADIGTKVQVQVTLPEDIKEETVKITMDGTELASGTTESFFVAEKAGTVVITVTGVTEEGEEKSVTAECTVYDASDKTPPIAVITAPTIDTVLTEPVDIIGSAYDAEGLDFWKLEYRMAGEKDYMILNEGTEPIEDGVLGHLDTTMLMNGQYNVRLTVQDQGGNITRLDNDYVVEGELKVGAMHIGFTDIDCLVSGIPLQVQRNYSSNNKSKGDFGIGWTMGLNDMQIRIMNEFCEGWEMSKSGSLLSTAYTLSETKPHDVIITYGDGSSERFEVVLNKNFQAYVPIQETKIEFKCVTNQKLKLAINGNNRYSTSGTLGENYLIGDDFEQMENPQNYILTLEDGTKVYLNVKNGIQKMEDTRGNTVTITKDGYEHSEGKGVTFKRDSEGRVIKATDSNGDYKEYAYDKDGNLASVTDCAGRTISYSYDKEHNLVSITDPTGAAIARNEYDEDGRLVAIIDADGNRTEYDYDIDSKIQIVKDVLGGSTVYSYDDNGNILSKTDALGHKTSYTYDNSNNVLSETDALNRTTTYAYDNKGNRTQTILPDGTVAKSSYNSTNHVTSIQSTQKTFMDIEYDEFGDATSVENGNGDITSYSYNDKGQLRSITDEIGEYTRFTYDANGNIKTMVNGNGDRTDFVYDELGNCISKTVTETVNGTEQTYTVKFEYDKAGNVIKSIDPENGITSYEYDENGNKTASIDANNNRTTFAYDSNGNLDTVQYADGTSEHFTYDAAGNNLTATSRTGQIVTMEYDKLSQMTKMTDATGYTIEYKYDACGNLTETVTSEGAKTKYAYDDRNRNISVTDTYGNTTTYTYTETSQVETITDALGHVTEFKYDDCDNCIEVIYADGSSVSSEYDERGRLVGQKDPMGYKMSYRYDGGDHLTGVTDAEGNETTYEYNNAGELVSVTDALNHTTSYEYDGNSRLIKTINEAGQTAENAYDMAGNLISQTAWDGTKTTYLYDDYGRLTKKTAGQKSISYEYDDMSRLTGVKDSTGTIQYAYDKYGRLASRTDTNKKKVSYTYDKAGRTTAVDTPYGKTTYEYDLLDRVTRVVDRNGEATLYEYDALGNRTAVCYPNGATVTYTYDACNRLKEEWLSEGENKIPYGYRYTTDKEGKRTKIEEIQADGSTFVTEYEYDKSDRLTKESLAYGKNRMTSSYTYDAASNRLTKNTVITGDVEELADVSSGIASSVAEGKTEYTYNELNQLVNEAGPDAVYQYIYDKNGNLIKETSSRAGDRQSELSYDEENHLVLATQQIGNEVTITRYTYDGEGNRIASQTNEQDTVYYVNDTSGLSTVLAETDKNGKEKAYYTIGQERLSLSADGKMRYYGYDGHGDTRLLMDEEGAVTDTYRYDAWGNLLSKTGSTSNTYLYTGESFDANTGLYYLRARYMNPENGLFISMDSYQGNLYEPVTLHKYLYANANPVVYTDPTGYFSFSETQIAQTIQAELNSQVTLNFKTVMKMVNVVSTCYSTTRRAVTSLMEGDSAMSVMGEWFIGAVSGALIGLLLPIACVVPKPVVTVISVLLTALIVPQVIEDWKNGDYDLAVAGGLQMLSSLSAIFMKCFTGDTLVATEDGDKRIDEIEVGDSVWAEDTVTGERVLKKVLKVYVKETDHLVHIGTSTGEDIETTENHPFYTEERGWVAAAELKEGETLHTEDGDIVTVTYNRDEWLKEPVKVYNLEVESLHTYYVTADRVLVHNDYEISSQEELSPEYFDSLTDNGSASGGGRSGDAVDLRGPANSFIRTDAGHIIIYGKNGTKIMDISIKRIKIFKFNQHPDNPDVGNWSNDKIKDSDGNIQQTLQWIIDYFGL